MKNPYRDKRPPEELTREELRARLIAKLKWTLAECEQFIRDVQYWNSIHPEYQPFDCEPERVIAAECRRELAKIEGMQ